MLLLLSGCAGVERGTFVRNEWPEMGLVSAADRRGLVAKQGDVMVLEGDGTLVSGVAGAYGIRFDEERNDLAAITARIATDAVDEEAVLLLFTTFEDRGAAGPAYFVPFYNEVNGTGMGAIDQRAEFGVTKLLAVVNLKQRAMHGERITQDAAHELAHRHLAYFPPLMSASSTGAIEILGRQDAHWHALLHSDGSLLGGHELRELAGGRFRVVARNVRFSALDLYGLGLFAAEEVSPFFFVAGGKSESGASIPEAAELEEGAEITGVRIDLGIEEVVRAAGPRDPGSEEMRVLFALVTRPGESATSTSAVAEAEAIDALRSELESAWSSLTRSRGTLCTRLADCLVPEAPDAGVMIVKPGSDCGCATVLRGEGAGHGATDRIVSLAPALLLAFIIRRVLRIRHLQSSKASSAGLHPNSSGRCALRFAPFSRCRARGPSCDRFPSSASQRRPGSRRPSH